MKALFAVTILLAIAIYLTGKQPMTSANMWLMVVLLVAELTTVLSMIIVLSFG